MRGVFLAATPSVPAFSSATSSETWHPTVFAIHTFFPLSTYACVDAEVANALSKGYRYRLPLEHTEGQVSHH